MPTRKADFEFSNFEVLLGLFHFWDSKGSQISANIAILHPAIFFIAQLPRYKKFWRGCSFQDRTFGKYCSVIEDWLFNMEMTSLICQTPDGDSYIVLPKLHTNWKNSEIRCFSKNELKLLEEMAKRLEERLRQIGTH